MPKQKTHSGAKKRFKVTGSGKILRRQGMKAHLLSKKSAKRRRKFHSDQPLHKTNVRAVKRLFGK